MQYILPFSAIRITDAQEVGGKTASLGEIYNELKKQHIKVPDGFAITAQAYWLFIDHNKFRSWLGEQLKRYDASPHEQELLSIGAAIRKKLADGLLPKELEKEIIQAYKELSADSPNFTVAVRSSATAEDLPGASFAGQQDSFLNVQGEKALLATCKDCFASLFTDRALAYRKLKKFDHFKVALSICVQTMVNASTGCSGVGFSLDTESGNPNTILLEAVWGLGESIVQGKVVPDAYRLCKPLLADAGTAIIDKVLGTKKQKMVAQGINKTAVHENPRK